MWSFFRSGFQSLKFNLHKTSKRFVETNVETNPITYHDMKNVLLKRTKFVKVSTVLSILGGTGVLMYYIHDWENTAERQLAIALNRLEDIKYNASGFSILNDKLFVTKRVFSGPVGIPVGFDASVCEEVIRSLVPNILVSSVTGHALNWIYKLVSHSGFESHSCSVLLNADPGLDKICSVLTQSDYSVSTNWILASHILYNMEQYKEKFVGNESFLKGIESLVASGHPLAIATASRLYDLLPPNANLNEQLKATLDKNHTPSLVRLNTSLTDVGLKHVPEYNAYPYLTNARGPSATLLSTLVFSSFATVWGKLLWRTSIAMSSQYKTLVTGQDPQRVRSLRKQFLSHRGVGRAVFSLLSIDYILSGLLQYAYGNKLATHADAPLHFEIDSKLPLSSLYPLVQTTILLFGFMVALHTQRFVVVPLVLAGGFYNRDLVQHVPALDNVIGKPLREFGDNVEKIDKQIEQILFGNK